MSFEKREVTTGVARGSDEGSSPVRRIAAKAPHTPKTTATIPGNRTSLGFSEKYGRCRYGTHQRCAHAEEASQAPRLAEYEPSSGLANPVASCIRTYGRKNGVIRAMQTAAAIATRAQ